MLRCAPPRDELLRVAKRQRLNTWRLYAHTYYRAVAGNGKTQWLARRVDETITAAEGVTAADIVVFTYTNAAADTLRDRLLTEFGHADVAVTTLHSFANQFNIAAAKEADAFSCVCTMVREVLALAAQDESRFDAALAELPRRRFIYVDEAQDANADQFDLVRLLRRKWDATVTLVGDTAQSIFSFQGAAPKLFGSFFGDDDDYTTITGTENYRSSPAIVAAVNANLRRSMPEEPQLEARLEDLNSRRPELVCYKSPEDEVAEVCAAVADLVHREGYAPSEIAVLNRTNASLLPFCYELVHTHGIDVDLAGSEDPEGSDGKVTLRTCHSAKGGQWRAVFVTGCRNTAAAASPEEEAEEVRLFHVALSRARERMRVSYALLGVAAASRLTRYIGAEDAAAFYQVLKSKKQTAPIEFATEPCGAYARTDPPRHPILETSIENDLARMPLADLQAIMEAASQVRHEDDDNEEEEDATVPAPIRYHGMHGFFSIYMRAVARWYLVRGAAAKGGDDLRFLDPRIAEVVLLPFGNREAVAELEAMEDPLPEDVRAWPRGGDPKSPVAAVRGRTERLVDDVFGGDYGFFLDLKRQYGLAGRHVRRFGIWDQWKPRGRAELVRELRRSFRTCHTMLRDGGDEIAGLCHVLYSCLFLDFVAFSRVVEVTGDERRGHFNVQRFCESEAFGACRDRVRAIVEGIVEGSSATSSTRLAGVSIQGVRYDNCFDAAAGTSFVRLDFECRQKEQQLSLHTVIAAALSAAPPRGDEEDVTLRFVNMFTGKKSTYRAPGAILEKVCKIYRDSLVVPPE